MTTTPHTQDPGAGDAREPGLGDLGTILSDISADLSTLLRQEVELAKAELRQSTRQAGRGAGMLAGAAVAALLALSFLSVTIWWAIGNSLGRSWAALIITAFWAIVAAVLAAAGRAQLSGMSGLPRTAESVREIPEAMKGQSGTDTSSTGQSSTGRSSTDQSPKDLPHTGGYQEGSRR
ncbi:MAG TPA: phage holin family protein [Kineosporiaceae bacterium]|nr:phage holin family protein [Kineosporiaceae bacterium]